MLLSEVSLWSAGYANCKTLVTLFSGTRVRLSRSSSEVWSKRQKSSPKLRYAPVDCSIIYEKVDETEGMQTLDLFDEMMYPAGACAYQIVSVRFNVLPGALPVGHVAVHVLYLYQQPSVQHSRLYHPQRGLCSTRLVPRSWGYRTPGIPPRLDPSMCLSSSCQEHIVLCNRGKHCPGSFTTQLVLAPCPSNHTVAISKRSVDVGRRTSLKSTLYWDRLLLDSAFRFFCRSMIGCKLLAQLMTTCNPRSARHVLQQLTGRLWNTSILNKARCSWGKKEQGIRLSAYFGVGVFVTNEGHRQQTRMPGTYHLFQRVMRESKAVGTHTASTIRSRIVLLWVKKKKMIT